MACQRDAGDLDYTGLTFEDAMAAAESDERYNAQQNVWKERQRLV